MNTALCIAAGGALGAVLRHYASTFWAHMLGNDFPYGTLFVNILGSFLIGVIMETFALKAHAPLELRAFLVTGMLGGFTTFSTFSLDTYRLVETGHGVQAIVYICASVAVSLAAACGGIFLVRMFTA